jgi:hypothetical protein
MDIAAEPARETDAYLAGSERASRDIRFGEGLIPAFKGFLRTNEGSPAWAQLKAAAN